MVHKSNRENIRNIIAMLTGVFCVSIPASALAKPMSFQIVEQNYGNPNNGKTAAIFAQGDIGKETAEEFKSLVEQNNIKNAVVYFNSTGGLVIESIRLGQFIREKGFGTGVQSSGGENQRAMCASACVYAYVGGVARYLEDKTGRIGVHQYYSERTGIEKINTQDDLKVAQLLGSVIVAHLQQMGVSSALYVAAAMTDSSDMLWMNNSEAQSFDLVNNGELPARADIKLTDDGKPYLQISQIADKGETHVLIACDKQGITLSSGAIGEQLSIRQIMTQAVANSITINDIKILPSPGIEGMENVGKNGVQANRYVTPEILEKLNSATTIGFTIHGLSGHWDRSINVSELRDKISYYTRICEKFR